MRWRISFIIAVCTSFLFVLAYLFIEDARLGNALNKLVVEREARIKALAEDTKIRIQKEFSERYKQQILSFEKLYNDLKAERNMAKTLEEKSLKMKK